MNFDKLSSREQDIVLYGFLSGRESAFKEIVELLDKGAKDVRGLAEDAGREKMKYVVPTPDA